MCKSFKNEIKFDNFFSLTKKKEHEKERIYSLETLTNFNEFGELSYLLMIIRFGIQIMASLSVLNIHIFLMVFSITLF